MLQKFIRFGFLMVIVMVTACTDSTVAPIVEAPTLPEGMSFGLVTASTVDNTLRIRVAWAKATDANGDAEFYRHTMTASKVVTDSSTGPLPTLKQVNGLADTVVIKKPMPGDTVKLVSKIWSVRRGLQSLSPAEGNLLIIRADQPPPPPDSITVDTIVIPIMQGLRSSTSPLTKVSPLTKFKSIIPFKHEEDGTMIQTSGNTTIFTIIK